MGEEKGRSQKEKENNSERRSRRGRKGRRKRDMLRGLSPPNQKCWQRPCRQINLHDFLPHFWGDMMSHIVPEGRRQLNICFCVPKLEAERHSHSGKYTDIYRHVPRLFLYDRLAATSHRLHSDTARQHTCLARVRSSH